MVVFKSDKSGLMKRLNGYSRALEVNDYEGKITVKSGKYPHWRRFQRDLHTDAVNIHRFGYVVTHVHRRVMVSGEYERDSDCKGDIFMIPYDERPRVCIVTLKPIERVHKEIH